MADAETPQPAAAQAATPQQGLAFLHQYLKDLSFENPNAALGLKAQGKQPDINIDVNVMMHIHDYVIAVIIFIAVTTNRQRRICTSATINISDELTERFVENVIDTLHSDDL